MALTPEEKDLITEEINNHPLWATASIKIITEYLNAEGSSINDIYVDSVETIVVKKRKLLRRMLDSEVIALYDYIATPDTNNKKIVKMFYESDNEFTITEPKAKSIFYILHSDNIISSETLESLEMLSKVKVSRSYELIGRELLESDIMEVFING